MWLLSCNTTLSALFAIDWEADNRVKQRQR